MLIQAFFYFLSVTLFPNIRYFRYFCIRPLPFHQHFASFSILILAFPLGLSFFGAGEFHPHYIFSNVIPKHQISCITSKIQTQNSTFNPIFVGVVVPLKHFPLCQIIQNFFVCLLIHGFSFTFPVNFD